MENFGIFKELKLSLYKFDENKKLFEYNNCFNLNIDLYKYLAETILIVRFLRKHNIEFLEDNSGTIKLIQK
ncbi:MAG: hypothetical protein ACNI25_06435 [Halarcobacter sp.]